MNKEQDVINYFTHRDSNFYIVSEDETNLANSIILDAKSLLFKQINLVVT